MIGIGIGIPFRRMGAGIDAQAQAHYDRVIADGGLIPSGLVGVNNFFKTVKGIYGTSDITTAISVGLDAQVLGYKLGAGAGTTAGQAAQKLYSCSGSSGDVVQTTAASQPLLLVHSGANSLYVPNIDGNNCTTPDAVINRISGDIEIISYIEAKGTQADRTIISKGTTADADYLLAVSTSNIPYFVNGDLNLLNATAALPNVNTWLRVTRVSSTGDIKFWTSTDSKTTEPLSVNWTQLGTTVSGPTGARTTTTGVVTVGKYSAYTSNSFNGSIFRVTISNSIGGTPVVDFNPNQYNAANSQTQWTSSTGEIWSIQTGTATTGYKGQIVTKTTTQGDGVDDLMRVGSLPNKQYFSLYLAANGFSSAGNVALFNGDVGDRHLIFQTSAASISAFNGTSLPFVGEVANRLYLATVNFNNTSSDVLYNNANKQTGATGTGTSTGYCIFGGTGNGFSNVIVNTVLGTTSVNTTTQNTDVYNYIKSINNNAF
jgi:hypothetical protein